MSLIRNGFYDTFRVAEAGKGWDVELTLRRLKPGILAAVGAVIVAGLAIAVTRALDFDMDFELDWEDMPA